ncbi:MAG: (2Fe-2S)-binding protein, partial [Pseudomonadota bacterium]
DIAAFLDGLPPEKMHCSVMGQEALTAAVAQWRGEEVEDDDHEEGALVCKCFAVDEGMIERAVRTNKLTTLEAVTHYTKAGGGCLSCREPLEEMLAKVNAEMVAEGLIAAGEAFVFGAAPKPARKKKAGFELPPMPVPAVQPVMPVVAQEGAAMAVPISIQPLAPAAEPAAPAGRTPAQEAILVARTVEEMRPVFQRDGGDVELIDLEGSLVLVKLMGACAGCSAASLTLGGLQKRIAEALGRTVRVMPVANA